MCSMIDAFFRADLTTALKIHEELLELSNSMFIETNPIPVKTALKLMGMSTGFFRLPLVEMTERNKLLLVNVLKKYNLIGE